MIYTHERFEFHSSLIKLIQLLIKSNYVFYKIQVLKNNEITIDTHL